MIAKLIASATVTLLLSTQGIAEVKTTPEITGTQPAAPQFVSLIVPLVKRADVLARQPMAANPASLEQRQTEVLATFGALKNQRVQVSFIVDEALEDGGKFLLKGHLSWKDAVQISQANSQKIADLRKQNDARIERLNSMIFTLLNSHSSSKRKSTTPSQQIEAYRNEIASIQHKEMLDIREIEAASDLLRPAQTVAVVTSDPSVRSTLPGTQRVFLGKVVGVGVQYFTADTESHINGRAIKNTSPTVVNYGETAAPQDVYVSTESRIEVEN